MLMVQDYVLVYSAYLLQVSRNLLLLPNIKTQFYLVDAHRL